MNDEGCPIKISEIAEELIDQLRVSELPDDCDPGEGYYLQIIANVRHQYTNYETLLYELDAHLWDYDKGEKVCWTCPRDKELLEDEECRFELNALDYLKWAAKDLAVDIYNDWLERRNKKPLAGL